MTDSGTVSVWLGIIASVLLIQLLILIVAVVAGLRLYRRALVALNEYEQRQIAPLLRRVNAAVDDLQDVLGRVRSADEQVRHALSQTGVRALQAASRVRTGFWPVVGLGRGVWAALASFRRRQRRSSEAAAEDETRFAYQGGSHHVRS